MSPSLLSPIVLLFVLLGWFVRLEESGDAATVLYGVASRICSKQHMIFSCSSHIAFSLDSMLCIHTVVLTKPQKITFCCIREVRSITCQYHSFAGCT